MADGIAPAIDKVGAPEPAAPEAKADAPSVDGPSSHPADAPSHQDEVDQPDKADKRVVNKTVGGPKPVEVMSVPETPANGATPAGATPRPELKTVEEPAKEPAKEPVVMSPAASAAKGDGDDAPGAAADKAATGAPNGDSKPAEVAPAPAAEPAAGDKRKLDNGAAPDAGLSTDGKEKPAKKPKVGDVAVETNGRAPARKVGRPRKDKNAAPVVGKTARKTRSQGPADV